MTTLFYASILITALFFLSGFEKIYFFAARSATLAKKISFPLALAQLAIAAVIILEISAPVIIASYTFQPSFNKLKMYKCALISLMVFIVLATALYHDPFKGGESFYTFMSNISTFGGLLALYHFA